MTPPRQAEALRAGLRRARLETVDGAGHMVMLEKATALAAVIRGFAAELSTQR
jgi:pimeloyl-ACP methyl ester carboxylesterase